MYWPTIRVDALKLIRGCLQCARYNIQKRGFHPLKSITAQLPFDHVAIDLAKLPLSSDGYRYLCVLTDICTKFVFLNALKLKDATSVASSILKVFCTVGFPKVIQSDNGSEFANEILFELSRLSGVDQRLISAYFCETKTNASGSSNFKTLRS